MKCPVCPQSTLVMSDRQGVEIDYCPQCRGVWLDRGELDKIIDRSAQQAPAQTPVQAQPQPVQAAPPPGFGRQPPQQSHPGYPQQPQQSHPGYPPQQPQQYRDDHYHKRKKKGFLGELFDFD